MMAYALGASWFDRRLNHDGSEDDRFPLGPAALHKLCRDLKATHECMKYKSEEI